MRELFYCVCCLAIAFSHASQGGELDKPKYTPGDAWIYKFAYKTNGTLAKGQWVISISRNQGDRMVVAYKEVGLAKPPREFLLGGDWSIIHSINGVETVVVRPVAFPLFVGKSWRVEYSESYPAPDHSREQFSMTYKVLGWEKVTTAAGEFKALKIEGIGRWWEDHPARVVNEVIVSSSSPNVSEAKSTTKVVPAKRITGRFYKVSYYAPSVKRAAKSIEENYDANGEIETSLTMELKDFHVGGD
jgi:hypothetical protein